PVYVMLHKPRGMLSSTEDELEEGRPTVREMVPLPGHLYPVGAGQAERGADSADQRRAACPPADPPPLRARKGLRRDAGRSDWRRGAGPVAAGAAAGRRADRAGPRRASAAGPEQHAAAYHPARGAQTADPAYRGGVRP